MTKFKFKTARMGFPAGSVVESDRLTVGVLRTLLSFGVLEEVKEDGELLVDKEADKPKRPARKPRSSKGTSKVKSK